MTIEQAIERLREVGLRRSQATAAVLDAAHGAFDSELMDEALAKSEIVSGEWNDAWAAFLAAVKTARTE